jgi:hypothetical protein
VAPVECKILSKNVHRTFLDSVNVTALPVAPGDNVTSNSTPITVLTPPTWVVDAVQATAPSELN